MYEGPVYRIPLPKDDTFRRIIKRANECGLDYDMDAVADMVERSRESDALYPAVDYTLRFTGE